MFITYESACGFSVIVKINECFWPHVRALPQVWLTSDKAQPCLAFSLVF